LIRFPRSEAGTYEYVREAAGVVVGIIAAVKLFADPSTGPSPVRFALVAFAGAMCGLLPSVLVWARDSWRSRCRQRRESGGGCGGPAGF